MKTIALLQKDIAQFEKTLKDPHTSEQTRKFVQNAVTKAKALLETASKEPSGGGSASSGEKSSKSKSASAKKSGKRSKHIEESCEELLRRARASLDADKKRRNKRKREGLPPELTAGETVKKAAKAVKTKVKEEVKKDGKLPAKIKTQTKEGVISIVKTFIVSLKPKDAKAFIRELISQLQKMLKDAGTKKYEDGGTVGADGEPVDNDPNENTDTGGGQNIEVFGYQTKHFIRSAEATEIFKPLVKRLAEVFKYDRNETVTHDLATSAQMLDRLFELEDRVTGAKDADKVDCQQAVNLSLLAQTFFTKARQTTILSFVYPHVEEIFKCYFVNNPPTVEDHTDDDEPPADAAPMDDDEPLPGTEGTASVEQAQRGKHIGFDALAEKVEREYREKGYSKEQAHEIGQDTAGKVYREQQAHK